jgi:hypothetical protein
MFIAASLFCCPSVTSAATASFRVEFYRPPQSIIDASGGVLNETTRIVQFFVTTDADILSFGSLQVSGTFFQHPVGFDAEPPQPIFFPYFPTLLVDSWVTTPGFVYDTSDDGPVTDFMFASMTFTAPRYGEFTGDILLRGPTSAERYPFNFNYLFPFGLIFPAPELPLPMVPEPASLGLAAWGLLALARFRRAR